MNENPYEKQHRYKKATVIADFIDSSEMTVEQLEKLSAQERTIIASLARVNSPSEETWNLVVDLVKKRRSNPLVM